METHPETYMVNNRQPDGSLEIISVRLYDCREKDKTVHDSVMRVIDQMPAEFKVTLFYNPIIRGEWTFHIHRPISHDHRQKSEQGLCLAEILRAVGVINHLLLCPYKTAKLETETTD